MSEINITFHLHSITCYITNILKSSAKVWNFGFHDISMDIIRGLTIKFEK
jgi:hypothetical protein